MDSFDLIIIGAGPGGYTLALRMVKKGWKVALVERLSIGGTCLNQGCIPTKALLATAKGFSFLKNCSQLGLEASEINFDWKKIQTRKENVINQLRSGVERLLKRAGITFFSGKATVLTPKTVRIIGHETFEIESERICLAVGSEPWQPPNYPKPDKTHFWTSNEALFADDIPNTLLIIGGGVIGLELGQVYAEFGAKVTIVEMMPQILPGFDSSTAKRLLIVFKKIGIEFVLDQKVDEFITKDQKVIVTLGKDKREFEKVLFAMGRKPNLSCLEHSSVNLELFRNFVVVNKNYETSIPGIFAIGDCISGPMLAHKASYDAYILARQFGGDSVLPDYSSIPSYVYTYPEIGWVGLSEEEAQKREIPYKVGRFLFSANGKALVNNEPEGQVKTIVSPDGKLLGASIWGMDISSLLAEANITKSCDIDLKQFSHVIHAHPTLSEAFAEAFENAHGLNVHG